MEEILKISSVQYHWLYFINCDIGLYILCFLIVLCIYLNIYEEFRVFFWLSLARILYEYKYKKRYINIDYSKHVQVTLIKRYIRQKY